MTELFLQFTEIDSIAFFLMICAARPLGFFAVFTLANVLIKRSVILKASIAFALGLPVMVANIPELNAVVEAQSLVMRAFLPAKEAIVGFLIGFIASLPFVAFKFAGHICDSYRGESSNGIISEGSENLTTLAMVMFLILSLVFLADEGLWQIMRVLYGSYMIWPIDQFLPSLHGSSPRLLVMLLQDMFLLMIKVGLPLLLILVLVDLFLALSDRIARRFGFSQFNFTAKNLVLLLVLPVYTVALIRVAADTQGDILSAAHILNSVFQ